MIKRTIEISREAYHLAAQLNQLKLRKKGSDDSPASIPCEDIGVVLVDNPATTYTQQALTTLADAGAAVVLCGKNHLPAAMLLPFAGHSEIVWRLHAQIRASQPLCKRLWKQIIRAKIRSQAANLDPACPARVRLLAMVQEVKSGDPDNLEAQASSLYWSAWIQDLATFRREPEGHDPLNSMLNYGYAVLRAAVARALVAAGLLPALGLHHRHRANAFCLADDLMEPMRPWVDRIVRDLFARGVEELNGDAKRALLSLLTATVRVAGETGPLMVSLHRTAISLVYCLQKKERRLQLPQLLSEAQT